MTDDAKTKMERGLAMARSLAEALGGLRVAVLERMGRPDDLAYQVTPRGHLGTTFTLVPGPDGVALITPCAMPMAAAVMAARLLDQWPTETVGKCIADPEAVADVVTALRAARDELDRLRREVEDDNAITVHTNAVTAFATTALLRLDNTDA